MGIGFIFLLLFGYALSWVGIYVGLSASDARVVQNVSFIVTFPLTFLSNAFAPTTGMPRALQYFAEWNPVSTMVAGCRELFGLQNIFGVTANSWPSQNPLEMSLIYMVIIMGDEMEFLLGSREISSGDLDVYSEKSPLGAAVMGAKIGDTKSYNAPNGKTISVKILKAEVYS